MSFLAYMRDSVRRRRFCVCV